MLQKISYNPQKPLIMFKMNKMMIKPLMILMIFLCSSGALTASVVMSKPLTIGGKRYHETWFLGSNEEAFHYHKHGGGHVDDGLFVAIPNGGPYGGYSYYEIKLTVTGQIDGGPAYLPNNPGNYLVSGFYIVVSGHGYGERAGFRKTSRYFKQAVPELPDGTIIPIGSKFFFWISRGGSFSLTDAVFEKVITLAQEVHKEEEPIKTETVEEQSAPEESPTLEEMLNELDEGGIEVKVIIDEDSGIDVIFFDNDKEESHSEL